MMHNERTGEMNLRYKKFPKSSTVTVYQLESEQEYDFVSGLKEINKGLDLIDNKIDDIYEQNRDDKICW